MQSRYRKGSLLVVLLFVIVMTSQAAALNQADILIVRDGHTLKEMDVPEDKFVDKYRNVLDRLKNLSVEVHTTDPSGLGPSASYMNQFDAVIWYTLDDYKENEDCPSGDCKTLYEEDVNNLTTYLKDYNGRL
ncbi:MAG: hypothetical protein MUP58_03855, partial [Candidatus Nanohaloarchaeota archaeon QJJ-9]|nr:hypothetical protein [Candidatus Nanohaloarchaeota archaeon QJJ-9]